MAYGYTYSGSTNTGSIAPLDVTNSSVDIKGTFESEKYGYLNVLQSNPKKLILGLPYYGYHATAESSEPGAKVRKFISSPRYYACYEQATAWGRHWQTDWVSPNYTYYDTAWHQVFYDDSTSLGIKYRYALSKKIAGIGMWALGYDAKNTELWNCLKNNLTTPLLNDNSTNIINSFTLNSYPNPFNPTTQINFSIPNSGLVSIKIYDMIGNEVCTLINEYKSAGSYNIKFSAQSLSSGIYLGMLKYNNYFKSIKLNLVK